MLTSLTLYESDEKKIREACAVTLWLFDKHLSYTSVMGAI